MAGAWCRGCSGSGERVRGGTLSAGGGGLGNLEAQNVPLTCPPPTSRVPLFTPLGPDLSTGVPASALLTSGPDHSLLGAVWCCIPGLYPQDSGSTPPSCDPQNSPEFANSLLGVTSWASETWPLHSSASQPDRIPGLGNVILKLQGPGGSPTAAPLGLHCIQGILIFPFSLRRRKPGD